MRKPYFNKQRKTWYLWQGSGKSRRQINLGKDKKVAFAKYHQLMLSEGQEISPTIPVIDLLDRFLCWVEQRRKPRTLEWYLRHLKPFSEFIGSKLTVAELKAHHVTRYIEARHQHSKPNTIHGAIRAIQRAFNWAIREDYLTKNPVAKVEKPTPTRREMVLSHEQFDEILNRATDQHERDLLEFMWETGARPQEMPIIESQHVDLKTGRIVFPASEGKGNRARSIYLTDRSRTIVSRLMNEHPTGPLFLNSRGKPWNKNSIKCRFRKHKMQGLCATVLRHSWVTRSLIAGIDPVTVSVLAGHKNLTMVANNYSHLAQNPTYLKSQLDKLKGTLGEGEE